MNRSKLITASALFGLVTLLSLTRTARAYIDPGTGSMLLQVLLGTALGMAAMIGVFWRQLTHFLKRLIGKGNDAAASSESPPEKSESNPDDR